MKSMYSYVMDRIEKIATENHPHKDIILKEYHHLIKTAVSHGDLDEVDEKYVVEIMSK